MTSVSTAVSAVELGDLCVNRCGAQLSQIDGDFCHAVELSLSRSRVKLCLKV